MHACGHDLHTAMLVGAVHLPVERRDELAGDVVFMFQPGEEGHGGAALMLAEGVLDASGRTPIAAYALHVFSASVPHGVFATRRGTMLAGSDRMRVIVQGAGGHGSAPHLASDPIPAACEIVTALQTFVTRRFDVFDPVVVTVGSIHAGTHANVIPDCVELEATVRSFSPEASRQVQVGAIEVCRSIAAAHGLRVEVKYDAVNRVTVNDADEAELAAETIAGLHGADRFGWIDSPLTVSEDFSHVLAEVPGAFVMLGACGPGVDHATAPYNHSPAAVFDDSVLSDGAAVYAELAVRRLGQAATEADGG
jgi:hippurate hydrolase